MSPGESKGQPDGLGRRRLYRAAAVALAATTGVGALAYAATRPIRVDPVGKPNAARHGAGRSPLARAPRRRPPKPRIVAHPEPVTMSSTATFRFTVRRGRMRFQCRSDRSAWKPCRSPVVLEGLAAGGHRFLVRAIDRLRQRGPAARFDWQVAVPRPFSISQLPGLRSLYPGAPPQPVPLALGNPNAVPIFVTGLRVTVTSDPVGCDSGRNLELTPSNVSGSAPLEIPPGGSVTLPGEGFSAPAIQLRELPESQDACQGGRFGLAFSGEARG